MYTHVSLRVTRERARESERGRARGQVSCRKRSNQEQSNQARSSQEQSTQSHPTATRSYPRPRRPHAAPPSAQATRGSSPQQRGSTERQLHRLRTHGLHTVSQDALVRRRNLSSRLVRRGGVGRHAGHGTEAKTAFIATVKRLVPRSFARFSFRV